jgi:hypothetical protein
MPHLTLWPNHAAPEGTYACVPWSAIVDFVAKPIIHEEKATLEGWAAVKFRGPRSKANVEEISLLVLDLDDTTLSLDEVCNVFAGVSGLVHTTHSSTIVKPKYRIVLRLSRDITRRRTRPRLVPRRALCLSQNVTLDRAARDASRLFYVPARRGRRVRLARAPGGAPGRR